MDLQKKAYQIIYDITGIVLKWDKKQLSDKSAMKNIFGILESAIDEKDEEIVLLNNIEVDKESIGNKKEKLSSILAQKKVLSPIIIGVVFFAVMFGVTHPFEINNDVKIVEEKPITYEQLDESPSNGNKPVNSEIEEFGNKTISKQD